MSRGWFVVCVVLLVLVYLGGCARQGIVETQIIEKPVTVPCRVESPPECKTAYAVDRVSSRDDALTINRAMRIELEERTACELKMRAALKGCNLIKMGTP